MAASALQQGFRVSGYFCLYASQPCPKSVPFYTGYIGLKAVAKSNSLPQLEKFVAKGEELNWGISHNEYARV